MPETCKIPGSINTNAYFLTDIDRRLLIELICSEQSEMIKQDPECYTSDRYLHLERLKIQLKD